MARPTIAIAALLLLLVLAPLGGATDARVERAVYANATYAGVVVHDHGEAGAAIGGTMGPGFAFRHGETAVSITVEDVLKMPIGGNWFLLEWNSGDYVRGTYCGSFEILKPEAPGAWAVYVELPADWIADACDGDAPSATAGVVTATFTR